MPSGSKHRVFQKFGIAFACHALDDLSEDDVGGIAIFEFLPRGKAQLLLAAERIEGFRSRKLVRGGRTPRRPKIVVAYVLATKSS